MLLTNSNGLTVEVNGFAVLFEILVDDSYIIESRRGFDTFFS